jgi:actin-related protein 8
MTDTPASTSNEDSAILEPSSVIVFHPGSLYLRFGRASDLAPQKIFHAIARRRKSPKYRHHDHLLIPKNPDVSFNSLESCRQKLMTQLQKSIRSDGRKRAVPQSKKIAELNASQQPSIVTNEDENTW